MTRVLLIGLAPEAVTLPPGLDAETLRARIAEGNAAVEQAGYDIVRALIGNDHAAGLAEIRRLLADPTIDIVMIGNGVRGRAEFTELFEQIVNAGHELAPQARFAFNADPTSTLQALQRNT
ncbi:hypothetical protein LWF15_07795 [Kineosporia rhizophila]|uniref:hypothetical protein n=1 Tax=Kineosporia TaxID=49184 RepID=UPI001E31F772|nr:MULTISPECIES: hypothetical protein [Kineosporia]MCE0535410.1 hypothetical protein [Kineosporia rhizophila]GLY16808.1 hypothetical protein Kisp01_38230 [Kineosporia sp. NBRC 101677]